jgi:hypothetical protein
MEPFKGANVTLTSDQWDGVVNNLFGHYLRGVATPPTTGERAGHFAVFLALARHRFCGAVCPPELEALRRREAAQTTRGAAVRPVPTPEPVPAQDVDVEEIAWLREERAWQLEQRELAALRIQVAFREYSPRRLARQVRAREMGKVAARQKAAAQDRLRAQALSEAVNTAGEWGLRWDQLQQQLATEAATSLRQESSEASAMFRTEAEEHVMSARAECELVLAEARAEHAQQMEEAVRVALASQAADAKALAAATVHTPLCDV